MLVSRASFPFSKDHGQSQTIVIRVGIRLIISCSYALVDGLTNEKEIYTSPDEKRWMDP